LHHETGLRGTEIAPAASHVLIRDEDDNATLAQHMKVVALLPSTNLVQVVLVEGDTASFTVPFREEWKLADGSRLVKRQGCAK